MIRLHHYHTGEEIWLNPQQIIRLAKMPDTFVYLGDGSTEVVKETPDQVRALMIAYEAEVISRAGDLRDEAVERALGTAPDPEPQPEGTKTTKANDNG